MSNIENYDGLCGIIATFATSDMQLRCQYELGHSGPCSFEKYRSHFICMAGCYSTPTPERGFIDSVLSHQKGK
jgi:hypothetical protein